MISKYDGKLYATGAYSTYSGAPLAKGMLFDDKVLDPWHASGYNVTTGAVEYAPAFDRLPKYYVYEKEDKFFVRVTK